ncbi:hypothetical protein GRS80_18740 [Natrialba sp. INN-245]|nr:hypothetical protein [Natrialba sp. INN-245]
MPPKKVFRSSIVATESHCTPDRPTDRRSVCKSVQLLLSPERECRRFRPIAVPCYRRPPWIGHPASFVGD